MELQQKGQIYKMNYTYKLTSRGLCSELNSLLGFYESVTDKGCRIYIDADQSQYFKSVSIYDVFKFPDIFIDVPHSDSTIVSGNKWRKVANKRYKTKLTAQQINKLFSYTNHFQKKLNKNIIKLSLPPEYNCFHIRRGDKVGERLYKWMEKQGRKGESKRYEFNEYFKRSDQSIKTIFIMSDDYSSIIEGQQHGLKVKTLTTEEQTGHSTDLDTDNDRYYNEAELLQFFSEIEIAKQSQQFIGTRSSNIFRYIKNQCATDVKFISLD